MTNRLLETRIIPRHCGGWLAISGDHEAVKIGVTALTAGEAEAKLAAALAAWRSILTSPDDDLPASECRAACH